MTILKLIGIEWFKTRRRPAFWVSTGLIFLVSFLSYGLRQVMHARGAIPRGFSLPRDWNDVSTMFGVTMVVLVALASLLVASERTWRTQRQNVIDGLSRRQFFGAKVLLVVLLATYFWALSVGNALLYAMFSGEAVAAEVATPLFGAATVSVLGGTLLYLVTFGCIALLFGIIASGTGAAMAFALLFHIIQMPVAFSIANAGGIWVRIAERFPASVMTAASSPITYDETARSLMNSRNAGAPMMLAPLENNLWVAGYLVGFVTLGWLAFRRRDL